MGLREAKPELHGNVWKWLVVLGIAAVLPLICSTTYSSHVKRIAFDGENLDVSLGGILPDPARIDLLITESEHGLDTDGSGSLTPSSFINEERYRQFILGSEGYELVTLADNLRHKASIDSSKLPELYVGHRYYLVPVLQHKGRIRIIDCIDITNVLLHHKTYKPPVPADVLIPVYLAVFGAVLLLLLFGAPLLIKEYRRRNPPASDLPEDKS
jgi:hypothetical protein